MDQNSEYFPVNLPILDGKNWNRWKVQMKALMGYHEVDEIVEQGLQDLAENATEEQKKIYKENKKNDYKAMILLHQCVDEAHFDKISGASNSKEAWQILEACNQGAKQLNNVRLRTLRRQYELMQMETNERVAQFFDRIVTHANAMKGCGEKISEQSIVEKILRSLTPSFDHKVVAIEICKKVEDMKIEDLQESLEAHEQRLIERSTKRAYQQALQAHSSNRRSFGGRNGSREARSGSSK